MVQSIFTRIDKKRFFIILSLFLVIMIGGIIYYLKNVPILGTFGVLVNETTGEPLIDPATGEEMFFDTIYADYGMALWYIFRFFVILLSIFVIALILFGRSDNSGRRANKPKKIRA